MEESNVLEIRNSPPLVLPWEHGSFEMVLAEGCGTVARQGTQHGFAAVVPEIVLFKLPQSGSGPSKPELVIRRPPGKLEMNVIGESTNDCSFKT